MIKNLTKKKVVSKHSLFLKGLLNTARGFNGKSKVEALIFTTRFGIHTFGLKFPIDILILSDERKVVDLRKNLKPNRIFVWNPKYKLVVEINKKLVKKSGAEIGDLLQVDL